MACKKKYVPGSEADSEEIFTFPYIIDENTTDFIKDHGRIMFIVRGFPGTGKNSLKQMIAEQFSNSVICTADNYFSDSFSSKIRSLNSLQESHAYCHRKVRNACQNNIHPIIVCNTHVKKREMEEYLKCASMYGYTIIMAITSHKFVVTPEILAKSNTKGLDVSYFRKRLKQWEDVPPVFTGWFLSQKDSSLIFHQIKMIIEVFLRDKTFCQDFNVNEKSELFDYFKAKKLLFCVAGYGANKYCEEMKKYYLSEKVLEHYGKCFEIAVIAFLITQSDIVAVVNLNETMKELIFKPMKSEVTYHQEQEIDSIISSFSSMNVDSQNLLNYSKTVPLDSQFSKSFATPLKESEDMLDIIKMKDCSFIHIAQHKEEVFFPSKIERQFADLVKTIVDSDGVIGLEKFETIEDKYKICHLPNRARLIKLPSKLYLGSIFTGLYT